ESGINAANLKIEITESCLMKDPEETRRRMTEIKERNPGIRIAIDDFGTGYSSLSYLKKLPVQTLKIDRSFVDDIVDDSDDRSITSSIISLAHNMGMDVVAEGAETSEQIEVLKSLGCERAQGYFYARPLPLEELKAWLNNRT
ncbi:MAG: EAL domain-containing protein, partial [Sulfurimonadaceae bacterium]|nr:EAL domain-containing protein [Sulfurimonadaceae bacterium]